MVKTALRPALVIGASGQIGKRMFALYRRRGMAVVGTCFSKAGGVLRAGETSFVVSLDIRDRDAVNRVFDEFHPSEVFLLSALTNVDYCEDHPDEAEAVNVRGVTYVAAAARRHDAKVIYVSTEYVFDGSSGPYREDDKPNPISVYGKTKRVGEEITLEQPDGLVARTTVVYDWDPDSKNFVMGLIGRLSAGQRMRVMNDQWSHPSLARNVAEVLSALVKIGDAGITHVVGPDYRNRYDFAVEAARILGLDESLIESVSTDDLAQRAPRPLRAGLMTDKVQKLLGRPLVGIADGVRMVKESREGSLADARK